MHVCLYVLVILLLFSHIFYVSGGSSGMGIDCEYDNHHNHHDILYIGDNPGDNPDLGTNYIHQYDAKTGNYLGFVTNNTNLHGIRGLLMIHDKQQLLVSNQNSEFTDNRNGEMDIYQISSRRWLSPLIPYTDPKGPFAPRGIVARDGILYVADAGNCPPSTTFPSRIATYSLRDGTFLGNLDISGLSDEWHPRGVVFDEQGRLYVSFRSCDPLGAVVLRFTFERHPHQPPQQRGPYETLIDSNNCNNCDFNRPEGIVIGPDNNLYITSFINAGNPNSTDKILVFNLHGNYLRKIDLDTPNSIATTGRAFAQALLFGPQGHLYVPITGNGQLTGEVRRYNPITGHYTVFIPAAGKGGHLLFPYYLTFTNTDPATLAYKP